MSEYFAYISSAQGDFTECLIVSDQVVREPKASKLTVAKCFLIKIIAGYFYVDWLINESIKPPHSSFCFCLPH